LIYPFKLEHTDDFGLTAKDVELASSRRAFSNLSALPPALSIG
jgi:hypothetical protein